MKKVHSKECFCPKCLRVEVSFAATFSFISMMLGLASIAMLAAVLDRLSKIIP